jgi:hypothetical protein
LVDGTARSANGPYPTEALHPETGPLAERAVSVPRTACPADKDAAARTEPLPGSSSVPSFAPEGMAPLTLLHASPFPRKQAELPGGDSGSHEHESHLLYMYAPKSPIFEKSEKFSHLHFSSLSLKKPAN